MQAWNCRAGGAEFQKWSKIKNNILTSRSKISSRAIFCKPTSAIFGFLAANYPPAVRGPPRPACAQLTLRLFRFCISISICIMAELLFLHFLSSLRHRPIMKTHLISILCLCHFPVLVWLPVPSRGLGYHRRRFISCLRPAPVLTGKLCQCRECFCVCQKDWPAACPINLR
jgi:hypothetical protein